MCKYLLDLDLTLMNIWRNNCCLENDYDSKTKLSIIFSTLHYTTPTLEETIHELAGSIIFTKVDGSSSYYCIILDYESSLLTTFNTHRGRFHFVYFPLRLACVQDIFQRMVDQILDNCDRVIGIADDITHTW